MSNSRNYKEKATRRLSELHTAAQRAARNHRKRMHAPPHAVAHHRRGITVQFARLRTAGAGAFASFLAVLGPGLLAGLSDDDPAGITTYSVLGTDHGYRLLWIIPLSTVLLVYFHLLAVRIGAVTGKGFVGIIRERWGSGAGTLPWLACCLQTSGRSVRNTLGFLRRRLSLESPRGSARLQQAC